MDTLSIFIQDNGVASLGVMVSILWARVKVARWSKEHLVSRDVALLRNGEPL